jgi:hypothetical protein
MEKGRRDRWEEDGLASRLVVQALADAAAAAAAAAAQTGGADARGGGGNVPAAASGEGSIDLLGGALQVESS